MQLSNHAVLSPEAIRKALTDYADRIPAVTPRMQRLDSHGALLERVDSPPPGRAARSAAVAVLLYQGQPGPVVVLTRRTDHLSQHGGQISFPGGRVEATDPSHLHAALREAQEELGIDAAALEPWAPLKPIYVPPSNYLVHPYVVYARQRPAFQPNAGEVAEVLEVPLHALLHPDCFTVEPRSYQGVQVQEPFFRYRSHRIWGATALMLDQLLARIQAGSQAD